MKRNFFFILLVVLVSGCSQQDVENIDNTTTETIPNVAPTKKDDSTACAYWKCSTCKKLYMQKYVKQDSKTYRPAGTYKLDQGTGAFPITDLDKYGSDGKAVSIDMGHDPCPYCSNTNLVGCNCGKTYCEKADATSGTCPWCGRSGHYQRGTWNTGGGG